jgi:hypothetical protein
MEGKPLRKPQPYWRLKPEARAHIDRICRTMRLKPPPEPPKNQAAILQSLSEGWPHPSKHLFNTSHLTKGH